MQNGILKGEQGVAPPAPEASGPKYVGAVENALRILRHLAAAHRPEGAAAIARATGINASTAFNILRTLAKEELVAVDPDAKTYRLGLGVLELSSPLLGANQADLIRPALTRLSDEHRVLMTLWRFIEGERMVATDRVMAHDMVRVDIVPGSRLPSFLGAVGRCYAACLDLDREAPRARLAPLRWHRAPAFEDFAADVEAARVSGLAVDRGQLFPSVDIAAAVIRDHRGRPRYGLSGITVAGLIAPPEFERMAEALRDEADRISATLFGAPPRGTTVA
ncbi:MAG: IclR family transcriptional regulator [Rhodobacteraceae bacterium]|nr:IclR family transcriptional regulator [Paracoccaceae bacterium]